MSDGTDPGGLSSLQELNFTRNKFNNLPNGIDRLPKLQVLCLYHCADLLSVSDLPSSLHSLMVYIIAHPWKDYLLSRKTYQICI